MKSQLPKDFYDIETGLRSKKQTVKDLREKGYTKDEIEKFYDKQKVNQITKPNINKVYHTITGQFGTYQIDIMFYIDDAKYNKGYIGMLLCLEITSRKILFI